MDKGLTCKRGGAVAHAHMHPPGITCTSSYVRSYKRMRYIGLWLFAPESESSDSDTHLSNLLVVFSRRVKVLAYVPSSRITIVFKEQLINICMHCSSDTDELNFSTVITSIIDYTCVHFCKS